MVEVKLEMLKSLLVKKIEMLEQILAICENQQLVLSSPGHEEFLTDMYSEKSRLIDEVLNNDNLFNKIFSELEGFEEQAHGFADEVSQLQGLIKTAVDLDFKIRAQERKNSGYMRIAKKPAASKPVKNLMDEYTKHNKGQELK